MNNTMVYTSSFTPGISQSLDEGSSTHSDPGYDQDESDFEPVRSIFFPLPEDITPMMMIQKHTSVPQSSDIVMVMDDSYRKQMKNEFFGVGGMSFSFPDWNKMFKLFSSNFIRLLFYLDSDHDGLVKLYNVEVDDDCSEFEDFFQRHLRRNLDLDEGTRGNDMRSLSYGNERLPNLHPFKNMPCDHANSMCLLSHEPKKTFDSSYDYQVGLHLRDCILVSYIDEHELIAMCRLALVGCPSKLFTISNETSSDEEIVVTNLNQIRISGKSLKLIRAVTKQISKVGSTYLQVQQFCRSIREENSKINPILTTFVRSIENVLSQIRSYVLNSNEFTEYLTGFLSDNRSIGCRLSCLLRMCRRARSLSGESHFVPYLLDFLHNLCITSGTRESSGKDELLVSEGVMINKVFADTFEPMMKSITEWIFRGDNVLQLVLPSFSLWTATTASELLLCSRYIRGTEEADVGQLERDLPSFLRGQTQLILHSGCAMLLLRLSSYTKYNKVILLYSNTSNFLVPSVSKSLDFIASIEEILVETKKSEFRVDQFTSEQTSGNDKDVVFEAAKSTVSIVSCVEELRKDSCCSDNSSISETSSEIQEDFCEESISPQNGMADLKERASSYIQQKFFELDKQIDNRLHEATWRRNRLKTAAISKGKLLEIKQDEYEKFSQMRKDGTKEFIKHAEKRFTELDIDHESLAYDDLLKEPILRKIDKIDKEREDLAISPLPDSVSKEICKDDMNFINFQDGMDEANDNLNPKHITSDDSGEEEIRTNLKIVVPHIDNAASVKDDKEKDKNPISDVQTNESLKSQDDRIEVAARPSSLYNTNDCRLEDVDEISSRSAKSSSSIENQRSLEGWFSSVSREVEEENISTRTASLMNSTMSSIISSYLAAIERLVLDHIFDQCKIISHFSFLRKVMAGQGLYLREFALHVGSSIDNETMYVDWTSVANIKTAHRQCLLLAEIDLSAFPCVDCFSYETMNIDVKNVSSFHDVDPDQLRFIKAVYNPPLPVHILIDDTAMTKYRKIQGMMQQEIIFPPNDRFA